MLLSVNNISKSFGSKKALVNITFSALSGKITGLLGPNGAGKTTLIRIILGIIPPDSGNITNSDIKTFRRYELGYVPEEHALYEKSKVFDNLIYFAELKGLSKQEASLRVLPWLEKLELTEYKNSYIETLSKGNRQKVQLIASLLHDPRIIIWDEPFSGLDPLAREKVIKIMREEAERGKIFIVSTHQLDSADNFCDSIVLLHKGKLLLSDSLENAGKMLNDNYLEVSTDAPPQFFVEFSGCKIISQNVDSYKIAIDSTFDKKKFIAELNRNYDIKNIATGKSTIKEIFFHSLELS